MKSRLAALAVALAIVAWCSEALVMRTSRAAVYSTSRVNGLLAKRLDDEVSATPKKPAAKRKPKAEIGDPAEEGPGKILGENPKTGKMVQMITLAEMRELKKEGMLDPAIDYVTESMARKYNPKLLDAVAKAEAVRTPEDLRKEKLQRETRENIRNKTGLRFESDEDDVPIVDQARWWCLQVRRNSERKICKEIADIAAKHPRFQGQILQGFHPESATPKMLKHGSLSVSYKPMMPGMVYVSSCMSPDIADKIESLPGVLGLVKNKDGLVVPLTTIDQMKITLWSQRQALMNDLEHTRLIKKDSYVSVVAGPFAGRYGICTGVGGGQVDVSLREERRNDEFVSLDARHVRYLENPPEKKWQEVSARSLLVCDVMVDYEWSSTRSLASSA